MKKSIVTIGLFSLMLVLTSFTSSTNIDGGSRQIKTDPITNIDGGSRQIKTDPIDGGSRQIKTDPIDGGSRQIKTDPMM
ncbi:MAG TPA: hypothetical protein VL859_08665 [Flavobacterium sp.]|nr:hypothetical protein [Flavobacterium sp.]